MLTGIVYQVKQTETAELGRYVLVDGAVALRFPVGDPDNHPGEGKLSPREILETILARPMVTGPPNARIRVTAQDNPEAWILALEYQYTSPYFWVSVKDIP